MTKKNPCVGPTVESFLQEEGLLEEVRSKAIKDILILQLQEEMTKNDES